MWTLWKVIKCGSVCSCTILVYGTQSELTASILQQPKQNLSAGQLDTYHSKNQPTKQATTPEHLTDYICTRLGLERSAGILPYADCFGSTFVCVYVLCLYIRMNSPCLGLELYGKHYKRQMKLFWTN